MTTATEAAGATRRRLGEGHGLIVFASVLLVILGCWQPCAGFVASGGE